MSYCFAKDCKHHSRMQICSFYRFPKTKKQHELWKILSGRVDRGPLLGVDKLCSCHFVDGRKGVIPITILQSYSSIQTTSQDKIRKYFNQEDDLIDIREPEILIEEYSKSDSDFTQENSFEQNDASPHNFVNEDITPTYVKGEPLDEDTVSIDINYGNICKQEPEDLLIYDEETRSADFEIREGEVRDIILDDSDSDFIETEVFVEKKEKSKTNKKFKKVCFVDEETRSAEFEPTDDGDVRDIILEQELGDIKTESKLLPKKIKDTIKKQKPGRGRPKNIKTRKKTRLKKKTFEFINVNSKLKTGHYCDYCNKKFPTLKKLKQHIITHEEDLSCHFCTGKFLRAKHLIKHIKKHHKTPNTQNIASNESLVPVFKTYTRRKIKEESV